MKDKRTFEDRLDAFIWWVDLIFLVLMLCLCVAGLLYLYGVLK